MVNPYINQMMNFYKSATNPQLAFERMMNSNPRMKQAMEYINSNGGDAKAAFYKLAEEKGIDPEEILSQFR